MALTPYTTDDLLTTVKLRAMLPDASSGSLSSSSLLQLASEELQGPLVGMILSAREQYFVTYQDTDMVSSTASYPIPQRALGGVVGVVQYIYNQAVWPLTPIDPATITTTVTQLYPSGFYFQNNSIVIYPTPNASQGVIRQRYFQRPSRLEQVSNCARITAFDTNTNIITVASAPTTWAAATTLDYIPYSIPYSPYGLDSAIASITGTAITMSSLPSAIAVGDYLAIAGFTPIPEVPYEFFQVLAQMTVCKALEAIGDRENLQFAQAKLQGYNESALKMITPRDQAGPKKVVSGWRGF